MNHKQDTGAVVVIIAALFLGLLALLALGGLVLFGYRSRVTAERALVLAEQARRQAEYEAERLETLTHAEPPPVEDTTLGRSPRPSGRALSNDDFQNGLDSCRELVDLLARNQQPSEDQRQSFDRQLMRLADLYLEANSSQRAEIRELFNNRGNWPLIAHIREFAQRMQTEEDVAWLRRGLAVAAIDDNRTDYRDVIVSLVLLRHGAERIEIETSQHFDEVMEMSTDETRGTFLNARDHEVKDVKSIIHGFGPQEWIDELKEADSAAA